MKFLVLLAISIFTSSTFAKTVARVADYGGKSFLFTQTGVSKELKYGDKIPDLSQLMVDDEAYVTVVDDKGNIHFLAGGSYVKFLNNMLEVQNGYVWTKAKSDNEKIIRTVNAVTKYRKGEFITTVNSVENRSQLLVLFGQTEFSSVVESHLTIPVGSGEFTFIDQSYEKGLPRRPTRVGIKSYHQIKKVFSNISSLKTEKFERTLVPKIQKESQKRMIASVEEAPVNNWKKKGKIIYIKTYGSTPSRTPQSVGKEASAYDYYKNLKQKKSHNSSKAAIQYYGFEFKKNTQKQSSAPKVSSTPRIMIKTPKKSEISDRQPASVAPVQKAPQNNIINDINSVFEKSYRSNLKGNQKHSKEVNELIDELKTFRNDFKKNY